MHVRERVLNECPETTTLKIDIAAFLLASFFHVKSRSETQANVCIESRLFGMCCGMLLILVLLYVAISISLFDPRIHTGILYYIYE